MNPLVQLKKAIPLFLAALILGLMGLTRQTDSQSPARPLSNKDGGDPPPAGGGWGACGEVAPGVWQQENRATGEMRRCSPTTVCRECVADPGSATGCSK